MLVNEHRTENEFTNIWVFMTNYWRC